MLQVFTHYYNRAVDRAFVAMSVSELHFPSAELALECDFDGINEIEWGLGYENDVPIFIYVDCEDRISLSAKWTTDRMQYEIRQHLIKCNIPYEPKNTVKFKETPAP
jgi:hypothetical protein